MARRNVSNVSIKVTADTKRAATGLQRFENRVEGLKWKLNGLQKTMIATFAIAAGTIAIAKLKQFGAVVLDTSQEIENMDRTAKTLGLTFNEAMSLKRVGSELGGIDVLTAFVEFQKRLAEAQNTTARGIPSGPVFGLADDFGFDIRNLTTDLDGFASMIGRVEKELNTADRLYAMDEITGNEEFVGLLELGEDKIRAIIGAMKRFKVFDEEIQGARDLNTQMNELNASLAASKVLFAVRLAPALTEFVTKTNEAFPSAEALRKFFDDIAVVVEGWAEMLIAIKPLIVLLAKASLPELPRMIGALSTDEQPAVVNGQVRSLAGRMNSGIFMSDEQWFSVLRRAIPNIGIRGITDGMHTLIGIEQRQFDHARQQSNETGDNLAIAGGGV